MGRYRKGISFTTFPFFSISLMFGEKLGEIPSTATEINKTKELAQYILFDQVMANFVSFLGAIFGLKYSQNTENFWQVWLILRA